MIIWRTVLLAVLVVGVLILATLLLGLQAHARWGGPCPKGSILRVHMGHCVSVHSALAAPYVHRTFVRLKPAPPHHVLRHGKPEPCDPQTQCGDPIEDRVIDPPPRRDPPQTGGTTPRDSWTPEVPQLPPLPDAFSKRGLPTPSPWRLQ